VANTFILKRSNTLSDVPTAGQLVEGELAINTNPADRKLYSKDSGGTVFEIGAFQTYADTGFEIRSATNTDAEDRLIEFTYSDSTVRGLIGYTAGSELEITNRVHGADIVMFAEDNAGNEKRAFLYDPDTGNTFLGDDGWEFATSQGPTVAEDNYVLTYDHTSGVIGLEPVAGGGNVSNTGTPVDGQIAVWTDATTIEGTAELTLTVGATTILELRDNPEQARAQLRVADNRIELGSVADEAILLDTDDLLVGTGVGTNFDLQMSDSPSNAKTGVSGYGLWWADSSTWSSQYPAFTDENSNNYIMVDLHQLPMQFSTLTTAGDPSTGYFRFNNATPASVTAIYVDDLDHHADAIQQWALLSAGDLITIRNGNDRTKYWQGTVDSTVDNTGWWTINVTHVSSNTLFTSTTFCEFDIQYLSQAGSGNVSNTGTPANNQVAVWTDATTIEGDPDFTWTGTTLSIGNNIFQLSDGTDTFSLSATSGVLDLTTTGGATSFDIGLNVFASTLRLTQRGTAPTNTAATGYFWVRDDDPTTPWFTDDVSGDLPLGYNAMPPVTISASQNFLLAEVGKLLHKSSGGAVTLTCAQDADTWDGATWVVHNDDTEDLTIAAGASVTVYWIEAGSAPAAGSVTVSQGGIVTVYKLSNTEFWVWGAKEAAAGGGISNVVEDTTPQLGGTLDSNTHDIWMKDNDQIQFGSATGGDAIMYFDGVDDLRIVLDDTQNFRVLGGTSSAEAMLNCLANGEVGIYYNGAIKLSTTNTGVNVTGTITADGLDMDDNQILTLGTGDDVDIYFNTVDLQIDMNSGVDFRVRGGAALDDMIVALADAGVELYWNDVRALYTQQYNANGNTSSAAIEDHVGVERDVGFNDLRLVSNNPASVSVSEAHIGGVIYADDNTGFTVTLPSSTTSFPIGGVITIINANTSVAITVADQASYTCFYLDGSTRTDIAGTATIAAGGVATIWRQTTGGTSTERTYLMWGNGITP
jgi:hypothetical protein